MRRSLIVTVAAAVGMVLLAMLVPMAVLLRDYALEDRLASAALEVQATETVVSSARQQGRGEPVRRADQPGQPDPHHRALPRRRRHRAAPGRGRPGPRGAAYRPGARRRRRGRCPDPRAGLPRWQQRGAGQHPGDPDRGARAGPGIGSGAARRAGAGRARPGPAGRRAADGRPARPVVRRPDPAAGRLDPTTRRGPPSGSRGGRRTTGGARARLDAEPPRRPHRPAPGARARGRLRPLAPAAHPDHRAAAAHRRAPRGRGPGPPRRRPRPAPADGRPRGQRGPALGTGRTRRGDARRGGPGRAGSVLGAAGGGPGPRLHPRHRRRGDPRSAPAAPTSRHCSTCCSTTSSPTPPRAPLWR